MSPESRARGFTLAELLVAIALGVVTLAILVSLVMATVRVSFRGTARVQLQQSALTATNRLAEDLANAPIAGVTMWQQPDSFRLAIHRLGNVGLDGEQVWADTLLVYGWNKSDGRLVRLEVPGMGTERARRPTRAEVQGWLADSSLPRRGLAVEVIRLELNSSLPPPALAQPLKLVMDLERGSEKFRLERDFFLMNSSL
ncbi:MAG: PilW family protein [Vulcanimicrobiota bacterium]